MKLLYLGEQIDTIEVAVRTVYADENPGSFKRRVDSSISEREEKKADHQAFLSYECTSKIKDRERERIRSEKNPEDSTFISFQSSTTFLSF